MDHDEPIAGVSRRAFVSSAAAAMSYLTGATPAEAETWLGQAGYRGAAAGARGTKEWHELPDLFGMIALVFMRTGLRNSNLYDTEEPPLQKRTGDIPSEYLHRRTLDGTWNDLEYPLMGAAGRRFGRNVPLVATTPDPAPYDPNPRTISLELMTRHSFQAASSLNVLAAAWIQFQVHDWFAHKLAGNPNVHSVPIPAGDPWPYERPMRFSKTHPDPAPTGSSRPPAYENRVPHWWDGSQIYGSDKATNDKVREFSGGRVKVRPSGLLSLDSNGNEITGFMENGWIGISLLHGVFALEHNAVCAMLARKYPCWSDDELYHKARLIVAALLARIHTLEWTTAVLDTRVLKAAMRTNWKGLLGALQAVAQEFEDSELLGGIVGSPTDHHTAPYAMTEEFVTVYRMHPLMPDEFRFHRAKDGTYIETRSLQDVAGPGGRAILAGYEQHLEDVWYSLGTSYPGAITLNNYPKFLQQLPQADGTKVDLATVEIVRDRERGVPRYNAFRRFVGKAPVTRFEDMTPDRSLAAKLESIYGNVDRVDAMVGLLAEQPPERFAFSDTAFRIFILMASRRLKSDRFFTAPFWCEETYTREGLDWIEKNSMASVLRRHVPRLRNRIGRRANAFRPWDHA